MDFTCGKGDNKNHKIYIKLVALVNTKQFFLLILQRKIQKCT